MKNFIFGYARVSTEQQNLDRQLDMLQKYGVDYLYNEKMTGTKRNRPELEKLLERLTEGDRIMNVLVITGSSHKAGTSAALSESFIKGAAEAGHTVFRFDSAFKRIHPCVACEKCHTTNIGCVFKDDMEELNPHLLVADVIVFATPIYYYAMSAQITAVIDRFYANGSALRKIKKAVLLVTMEDDSEETANGAVATFKGMAKYLDWDIAGIIAAIKCPVVDALNKTDYPKQAYELGKSL